MVSTVESLKTKREDIEVDKLERIGNQQMEEGLPHLREVESRPGIQVVHQQEIGQLEERRSSAIGKGTSSAEEVEDFLEIPRLPWEELPQREQC